MGEEFSLQKNVTEKGLYKKEAWKGYVEDYLLPFWKSAVDLKNFYDFLCSNSILAQPTISDIEDSIRDQIRIAAFGGIGNKEAPNSDSTEYPFAKFMFEYFGFSLEGEKSFSDRANLMMQWGDKLKVRFSGKSWINTIGIKGIIEDVRKIMDSIMNGIGYEYDWYNDYGFTYYNHSYKDQLNPREILPSKSGESPEKLINLLQEFKQRALNLAIGVNRYSTFIFLLKALPMIALFKFLSIDINNDEERKIIVSFLKFLKVRYFSIINGEEIILEQEKSYSVDALEKIFILGYGGLNEQILELNKKLINIDEQIDQQFNRFISTIRNEALKMLDIEFMRNLVISIRKKIAGTDGVVELKFNNGILTKIEINYRESEELEKEIKNFQILLEDFLLRNTTFFISATFRINLYSDSLGVEISFDDLKSLEERVSENGQLEV
ncbi:MAG: hypothetical protein ACP5FQ_06745 [Thermoplasmata archaeon]